MRVTLESTYNMYCTAYCMLNTLLVFKTHTYLFDEGVCEELWVLPSSSRRFNQHVIITIGVHTIGEVVEHRRAARSVRLVGVGAVNCE